MYLQFFFIAVTFGFTVSEYDYCKLTCPDWFNNGRKVPHTVCERKNVNCGPDPKCGPDFQVLPLKNKHISLIVKLHNKYRSRIARGLEKRGNQPKAANMRAMKYNKELAKIALCWASSCNIPLKHDKCRITAKYNWVGQNIGYNGYSTLQKNITKEIYDRIDSWYGEVADFDGRWVNNLMALRNSGKVVSHYMQVVWADTHEVGCGLVYFTQPGDIKHRLLMACNYGPGGNMMDQVLYKIGEPASQCPKGWNPRKDGLCYPKKK